MNRLHLYCIVVVAALIPAHARAEDELTRKVAEAYRQAAETTHTTPHATIPIREFLTDPVLARVPDDSAFFRNFLKNRTAESLDVSVDFPPDMLVNGYEQPRVDPVGTIEITHDDGSSVYINIAKTWATVTNRHRPNYVATVRFVLTVGYDMPDGKAALILPCSVEVTMTDKLAYSYANPAVDLKKTIVVTRPK